MGVRFFLEDNVDWLGLLSLCRRHALIGQRLENAQEPDWRLLLRPPIGVRDSVEVSSLSRQIMNVIKA